MIPLDLRAMELTTKAAAVVLSDLALRMAAVDVHQAEGIRPLVEVDLVAMGAKEPPCAALPAFEPEARVRRELTTRLYRAVARAVSLEIESLMGEFTFPAEVTWTLQAKERTWKTLLARN